MNKKPIVIGVSGVAGSGKDTFCSMLKKYLKSFNKECAAFSFAEALKKQVRDNSLDLYGIDPTNCSRDEKNIIRPFLVAHGKIMRDLSNGRHWVDIVDKKIEYDKINLISDVRYCEYPEDEVFWIKSNRGVVVHVSRFTFIKDEKIFIGPANSEEDRNDKIIKKLADFNVEWETGKSSEEKVIDIFKKIEKKVAI